MKKLVSLFLSIILMLSLFVACTPEETSPESSQSATEDNCKDDPAEKADAKPVIYLYPTEPTSVKVKLDYKGNLTCTYPDYNGGWEVTAYPNGRIIDQKTGKEYSYLFWEGVTDVEYDFSRGFVVKGEDTAEFLQKTLAEIGLTPVEYNEFIVYWLPRMQNNPYNLISFQSDIYTESAKLEISPSPDSLLRVFMAYRPLSAPIDIEPQTFDTFVRQGFTVVEWGGTEIR